MLKTIVSTFKKNLSEELLPVYVLAGIKFSILILINLFSAYGYFRDELYYLACSDHLDWGYVDQPPFSILVLKISRIFFGDSIFAIRLFPALSGAVVIILSGMIVREFGGKKFAQFLTGTAILIAPIFLAFDAFYSMNSFEILFWTISIYFFIRIVKGNSYNNWFFLGISLGIGAMNKISIFWLAGAIVFALLLSPARKELLKRDFFIAVGTALLLFSPYIIWQFFNDFASVEFARNIANGKYKSMSPVEFLLEQMFILHPIGSLVWISGLFYIFFSKKMKVFRPVGYAYCVVLLLLLTNSSSKPMYMAPVYPALFAAGGIAIESRIDKLKQIWLKLVIITVLIMGGIISAPMVLPVLPVESYLKYADVLGISPMTSEKNKMGSLPQHYADMFGWEGMVLEIAKAYNSLSSDEKSKCVILMGNYGEAGAVDFFGRKYDLPKAICGHNNYWLWGCRKSHGEVVIRLGGDISELHEVYNEVIQAGIFRNQYCMPYEDNQAVYILKNRKVPLYTEWEEFKVYN